MRIISGSARGRRLAEPKDMEIRPTTDQVKEAMFSILQFELEGRDVLDLFAGTGQLGLEALSRGAGSATFCDMSRDAQHVIEENIRRCGFGDRSRVFLGDARATISRLGKYDIILIDPPYLSELYEECLESIIRFDILREGGIIVCESAADRAMPELPAPYLKGREYRYGRKKLTLYRREVQST